MKLKLIWNNIIEEPTDAVVTPASRKPRIGTGLDKAIHAAAGEELLQARVALGEIGPGIVKSTPAFKLKQCGCKAKYVIHALGPWWGDQETGTERPILIGCYLQIFCTAAGLGAKVVSTPVMSSGKFGMPMEMALDIAVEAAKLFLSARPDMTIKIVGIDSDFLECAEKKYGELLVRKFDRSREAAYRQLYSRQRKADGSEMQEAFEGDEQQLYFRRVKLTRDIEGRNFKELLQLLWRRKQEAERKRKAAWLKAQRGRAVGRPESFMLKNQDLMLASGLTESYLKHLLSSAPEKRHPSKDIVLALCVALKLDLAYTGAMLAKCDEHLARSSRDAIIGDYIASGKGSVNDLNLVLAEKGCRPLVTNSEMKKI